MVIQGIQLKLTDRVDSMEVPNCSENLIYDVVNRMVVKIVMTNLFQLAAGYNAMYCVDGEATRCCLQMLQEQSTSPSSST